MKYYAVAQGHKTGIFTSWPETQRLVQGYPNAIYKSFKTREEAQAFLENPVYGKSGAPRRKKATKGAVPPPCPDNAVVVYTDGSAIGNPGPGGYGVVIQQPGAGTSQEYTDGFDRTTNNRMEMMAVIVALETLSGCPHPIVLHSDSQYVLNAVTKGWARGWKKRGWKKSDGNPALNPDLWKRLLAALEGLDIRFQWVKGHAGNPLNERCDELANTTARKPGHPRDKGFKG